MCLHLLHRRVFSQSSVLRGSFVTHSPTRPVRRGQRNLSSAHGSGKCRPRNRHATPSQESSPARRDWRTANVAGIPSSGGAGWNGVPRYSPRIDGKGRRSPDHCNVARLRLQRSAHVSHSTMLSSAASARSPASASGSRRSQLVQRIRPGGQTFQSEPRRVEPFRACVTRSSLTRPCARRPQCVESWAQMLHERSVPPQRHRPRNNVALLMPLVHIYNGSAV